jgi:hypothetical protein
MDSALLGLASSGCGGYSARFSNRICTRGCHWIRRMFASSSCMRVTNGIPLGCLLPLTGSHCKLRPNTKGHACGGQLVRCALSTYISARGVQLSFTLLLLRLTRCNACDQWHSSRVFTPLAGSHYKLRRTTEGLRSSFIEARFILGARCAFSPCILPC